MRRDVYLVRMTLMWLGVLAAFIWLGTHFHHLQIEQHDGLYAKARSIYTATRVEEGTRGLIRDKNGNLLAGNLACRDVLAEPERFRQRIPEVIRFFTSRLAVSADTLRRRFRRGADPDLDVVEVVVARDVSISKTGNLKKQLKKQDIEGIRFVDSRRRYYPKAELAANVLGFLNAQGKGAAGIERMLNSRLHPSQKRWTGEIGRKGAVLSSVVPLPRTPVDGADVYLTIDEPIQQIVENELERMARKHKPKSAYAVMADPRTGELMAMAQRPTFNPNKRAHMSPGRWQNRLAVEGFEPGSIMKCVSVAGALDYGVVSLDTVIDCEQGSWYHHSAVLHDAGHAFGRLPVRRIIQKSSNIGAAKVAVKMGPRRLYQTLQRFGFGEKTGAGFSNEAEGILRQLKNWDGLSVSRFAIGQGILATPLQLVQAYSAIANKGKMPQLHILDRVRHPGGQIVERFEPHIKRRAVRPAAAEKMVSAMKLVPTEEGTAPQAAVPPYEVAGKTGTAQKWVKDHYSHEHYVASFIGFVPADDPAFVLLVVANDPRKNGYYGGQVAGPTFSRIADKTLRYLQVMPYAEPRDSGTDVEIAADATPATYDISELP